MFDRLEKINIFRKFLLSYLLILIIPLLESLIIYQVNIHKIKDYASENSKNLLNQTRDIIDKKNDEIENFIYQMSLNLEINQLMYRKTRTDMKVAYEMIIPSAWTILSLRFSFLIFFFFFSVSAYLIYWIADLKFKNLIPQKESGNRFNNTPA
ncbi:hypothetical protein V7087_13075 [Neobacillus niacini]|uniref:hypothetical protein n=1 Tax=Neobacillus niacini TaxID=86668 RepID=UPI0030008605